MSKTIGVLALQGDFLEHILILKKLGVQTIEVRLPKDLQHIQGLIIPGGESTTMEKLIDEFTLRKPLISFAQKAMPAGRQGFPIWGTCAGMILLAKKLREDRPTPLGLMDITVSRNAFGRQINSFETKIELSFPQRLESIKEGSSIESRMTKKKISVAFIRAPIITNVGPSVTVLATLPDGTIVAAQEKNLLATSFHPELTGETMLHQYFLELVSSTPDV